MADKLIAKFGAVAVALSIAAIGGAGTASADEAPDYMKNPYTRGMIADGVKATLTTKLAKLPKAGSGPSAKPTGGSIISSLLKQVKNAISAKPKP